MSATALTLDDDFKTDGCVIAVEMELQALDTEQIEANFRVTDDGIVVSVNIHFPPIPVNLPAREHRAMEVLTVACSAGQLTLDGLRQRTDIQPDSIAGKLLAMAARTYAKQVA